MCNLRCLEWENRFPFSLRPECKFCFWNFSRATITRLSFSKLSLAFLNRADCIAVVTVRNYVLLLLCDRCRNETAKRLLRQKGGSKICFCVSRAFSCWPQLFCLSLVFWWRTCCFPIFLFGVNVAFLLKRCTAPVFLAPQNDSSANPDFSNASSIRSTQFISITCNFGFATTERTSGLVHNHLAGYEAIRCAWSAGQTLARATSKPFQLFPGTLPVW